jgi:hypothetical protein
MNKKLRVIVAGIFFATLLVYEGAGTYRNIRLGFNRGWQLINGNHIVIDHTSSAAPNELKDGDELVALNDIEYKNYYTKDRFFYELAPGEPYNIRIRREGKVLEFRVKPTSPSLRNMIFGLTVSAIFWLFITLGLIIFFLKPDDKRAILLSLLLMMFVGLGFPADVMVADRPAWLRHYTRNGSICSIEKQRPVNSVWVTHQRVPNTN